MKTASQKIPRDLDEYSDPKKMHWLPFLSSHSHKTNRFHFNADGEFRYVGRATFKKFAEEVLALNRNKSSLFLHGHMGVGKSHMMAALACFLTRIGKLVVYISDYSAFLSDPVTATKIALARAFWNRECELDKIFEMRTVDELKTYCMQISHRERIYLLIDYQAIFDVMPPGKNGAVQAQKSSTATILLNSLTDHDGFKVECVSGNYWHRLLFSHEEAYGKTFSMYDGLDEVCPLHRF